MQSVIGNLKSRRAGSKWTVRTFLPAALEISNISKSPPQLLRRLTKWVVLITFSAEANLFAFFQASLTFGNQLASFPLPFRKIPALKPPKTLRFYLAVAASNSILLRKLLLQERARFWSSNSGVLGLG